MRRSAPYPRELVAALQGLVWVAQGCGGRGAAPGIEDLWGNQLRSGRVMPCSRAQAQTSDDPGASSTQSRSLTSGPIRATAAPSATAQPCGGKDYWHGDEEQEDRRAGARLPRDGIRRAGHRTARPVMISNRVLAAEPPRSRS